jgi:membrane-bound lytic murein transglycosylase D
LPLPLQPDFDPIQDVIDKAENSFRAGEQAYADGHLEMAKQAFNESINTILLAPVKPSEDPHLQRAFDSLVERINRYEMRALQQGDGFAEPPYQPSPLDELQTLTFPDDPQQSQLLAGESAATPSQLPLVTNSQVETFIKYFATGRGRATLEAALQRSGRYRDMILRIFQEEGVPQEFVFLAQAESGFQTRARSTKRALGLWQFVASTGKLYGLERNWWVDERLNPEQATRAAARHLRDLYNQFGDWYLAMAAYNCGPQCVQRAVERTGYADFWELSRRKVLPRETRNYVPIILSLMIIGKNAEQYGIDDLPLEPAWAFDSVAVPSPIDLRLVAELVDTNVETIQELNPNLLRMTTPNVPNYTLRIPLASSELFLKRVAMIPPEKRVYWRWHTVRYGETLSGIAKKFKTSVQAIAEINNLDPVAPLHEAAELVIPVGPSRTASGSLAGPGERHRIARGETLSIIASRYNVTTDQLIAWNGLDSTLIRAGSTLIVGPEADGDPLNSASAPSGSHIVRRNETLSIIARRYRVTVAQLMAWNNLRSTTIQVGARLVVRGPSAPQSAAADSGSNSPTTQLMVHRAEKGESLSQIATNYRMSLETLRRSNQHLGQVLRVGDPVYIPATK